MYHFVTQANAFRLDVIETSRASDTDISYLFKECKEKDIQLNILYTPQKWRTKWPWSLVLWIQ